MLRKVSRYLAYPLLVAVIVGAVWYTIGNFPTDKPRGFDGAPPPPAEPWKPSAKFDAEANAGFKVDTAHKDNVALAGTGGGADWPQFNGEHRDNKSSEKNLARSWPKGGPPLAWTSSGLGTGFSSVTVVQGIVYTMGNKGESETIAALDAGTGQKILEHTSCMGHASGGGRRSAKHAQRGTGPRLCVGRLRRPDLPGRQVRNHSVAEKHYDRV